MINLLPPSIKAEIAYSKFNTTLIKLIVSVLITGATLVTIVSLGSSNTDISISAVKQQLAQDQSKSNIEKTLRSASERFNSVSSIEATRHRYSGFIRSLANALPGDAIINTLTLSSDAKPIKLNVSTTSSNSAGRLKSAIEKLPQVQAAEVDGITQSAAGFDVIVGITFKPEAFK